MYAVHNLALPNFLILKVYTRPYIHTNILHAGHSKTTGISYNTSISVLFISIKSGHGASMSAPVMFRTR